jgi:hypothetical protein
MDAKRHLTRERYLQLIDRCEVFSSSVDEHLIHHPVSKLDREIRQRLERIVELYQEIRLEALDRLTRVETPPNEDR